MDKIWYAVYVKSRSEKKVAAELQALAIDHYLPLQKILKKWSDRKKWIEEPLFRSYIFVQIDPSDYYNVLNLNGVVKYITFEGKAVPVPEQQIEAVKFYLNEKDPELVEDHNWEKGQRVEIISGSLIGLKGELVEVRGKHMVSVEIEAVGRNILLKIPKNKLSMII
jgi:transcription antitermination factor NusG